MSPVPCEATEPLPSAGSKGRSFPWRRVLAMGGDHRFALQAWNQRHSNLGPEIRVDLAHEWCRLVTRRPRKFSPQLSYRLFSLLADRGADRPWKSPHLRFAARLLASNPTARTWRRIDLASKAMDEESTLMRLLDLKREIVSQRRTREAAAVSFAKVEPVLRALASSFYPGVADRLHIQAHQVDRARGVTAWTDGRNVHLPAYLDFSEDARVNRWFYFIVLAHELEHVASGSFSLNVRTDAGRRLWRRLNPRRKLFHRRLRHWRGDNVVSRLKSRGVETTDPRLPRLQAFFMHLPDPDAAHGLYNLVEDARVNHVLSGRLPGLGRMSRELHESVNAMTTHPMFLSIEQNLVRGLAQFALGLPVDAHIVNRYRPIWTAAQELISAFRSILPASPEASATLTLDLIELFESSIGLNDGHDHPLTGALAERVLVPVDEIVAALGAPEFEEVTDYPSVSMNIMHREEGEPSLPGPWVRLPEFDLEDGRMVPEAVRLRLTDRTGEGFVPREHSGTEKCASRPGLWDNEGYDLNADRAHDFLVARRTGRSAEERVFKTRARCKEQSPSTLVVDLSASMENVRPGADRSPLEHIRSITSHLESSVEGAGLRVLGLKDCGRRSVTVVELKGADEGWRPSLGGSIKAMGGGGFRHAAAIRFLSRHRGQGSSGRRRVVILTDAAGHYIARGLEPAFELVQKHQCPRCNHKAACSVEPRLATICVEHDGEQHALYMPASYEMADLGHAIAEDDKLEVFLLVIGGRYRTTTLDRTVGRGKWRISGSVADDARWLAGVIDGRHA